uniref:Uncharacterized protein n=1 Tax=Steinernema glaseri TaxID=37863 RepID=A0A1I7ZW26_9BILA
MLAELSALEEDLIEEGNAKQYGERLCGTRTTVHSHLFSLFYVSRNHKNCSKTGLHALTTMLLTKTLLKVPTGLTMISS